MDKITKIPHTKEMIKEAHKWSKDLGSLNNSITKGRANAAARIAELALAKYWGTKPTDDYNHDILYKNQRIELKTKRRTVKPKDNYRVSVAKTSLHQKPDTYCFLSIEFNRTEGEGVRKKYYDIENIWYCGDISRKDFLDKSELWVKGSVDDRHTVHADNYKMRIENLESNLLKK